MRQLALVALVSTVGCKVVDAPDNLEELVVFGFETFGDERSMVATLDELVPLVDTNAEELAEGYRVDQLGADSLGEAGIETDTEAAEGIVGAMGLVNYRNGVDPVIELATSHDKEALFEQIIAFEATDLTDRACFLAHECPSLTQEVEETADVALVGESARTYTHTIYWLEHEEHGTVAAIRSLSPDPIEFSTNLVRVHQQYALAWIIPDGNGARRIEAFWAESEVIGVDVPDSFAVDTAVNQMSNQAANIDNIIEGITE